MVKMSWFCSIGKWGKDKRWGGEERGEQRRKHLKGFNRDDFEMNAMLFFYEDSSRKWLKIESHKIPQIQQEVY